MEKLFTVSDIQERYGCNPQTARKYIRQMEHMEKPLSVLESAITAWERKRTIPPSDLIRAATKEARRRKNSVVFMERR